MSLSWNVLACGESGDAIETADADADFGGTGGRALDEPRMRLSFEDAWLAIPNEGARRAEWVGIMPGTGRRRLRGTSSARAGRRACTEAKEKESWWATSFSEGWLISISSPYATTERVSPRRSPSRVAGARQQKQQISD